MSSPAPSRPVRCGVLAAGNFIVDHVKTVDVWPDQDSLARVVAESKHNGGGPYNVLKNLARLGAEFPLQALGLLGADAHGSWIKDDCHHHRIDTTRLSQLADYPTSYTDVMSVAGTGRRTFFHQSGANARLGSEHLDFASSGARYFYLGYLLLLERLDELGPDGLPAAAAVLRRAGEAGFFNVLDCVSDPGERWRTVVAPVLPEVDLLFANDYEAERLTGLRLRDGGRLDPRQVGRAAQALLQQGVRRHAIVHAPEGVWCASVDHANVIEQRAVAIPASEITGTTGAGDAFAAGVLYALHGDSGIREALELGVCVAAASLRHVSASDAVLPAADCLQLGRRYGFREAWPDVRGAGSS